MFSTDRCILIAVLLSALAGCADREVGSDIQQADFGDEVRSNDLAQIAAYGGDRVLLGLSEDFRRSAPDMITFAFDSAVIDPTAQRILDQQAAWILRHPIVRLRIYGNTDLVGSPAYNYRLGQRRANAVAAYLVARGVSRGRLEAVVSFGETRPVILTDQPERQNRRTVTEVVGYAAPAAGFDFDGKVAQRVYQEYVSGETPEATEQYAGTQEVFMPQ
jgi:outer membrane protein OmpA-like peptidoglycan-associated protein